MTTNAQLATQLRSVLQEDGRKYEHARLPAETRKAIDDAAQRLEAMDEFMNFAEAVLEHIDNPLIATHLSAVIQAAFGGER